LAKHAYSIRFRPDLYLGFRKVAKANGYTATAAFERFMSDCVKADTLVFADLGVLDLEAEARVLLDWLGKGEWFYGGEDGSEVSIQGRLLWLMPRVHDSALKRSIEEKLKAAVSPR
jgi:hypothetical protein